MIVLMSALRLTKINLYKHFSSVNFWVPFILAVAAVYEFTNSLANMSSYYSVPVNGFAVSFLFTSLNQTFIIFLGVFILFCDLPFKDNQQIFLISRSGKRAWIFSQVFYIVAVSFVYCAFILICFIVFSAPNIGFDMQNWGKIIRTISVTNAQSTFELMFSVPKNVLSDFSPVEAFLYSFGIALAVAIVLGLLALLLNLIAKHSIGITVCGALIFMYMFVNMGGSAMTYYFSPLNWCSISVMDKKGVSVYPDVSWIIAVLCVCLAVEIITLFEFGDKKIKFVLDTKEEVT